MQLGENALSGSSSNRCFRYGPCMKASHLFAARFSEMKLACRLRHAAKTSQRTDLPAHRITVHRMMRHGNKLLYMFFELVVCALEDCPLFFNATQYGGGVLDIPFSYDGIARPCRMFHQCSVPAERDDVIKRHRSFAGKFIPPLGAHVAERVSKMLDQFRRKGIDQCSWVNTRTVGLETPIAFNGQQGLGQQSASRVSSTQK